MQSFTQFMQQVAKPGIFAVAATKIPNNTNHTLTYTENGYVRAWDDLTIQQLTQLRDVLIPYLQQRGVATQVSPQQALQQQGQLPSVGQKV